MSLLIGITVATIVTGLIIGDIHYRRIKKSIEQARAEADKKRFKLLKSSEILK